MKHIDSEIPQICEILVIHFQNIDPDRGIETQERRFRETLLPNEIGSQWRTQLTPPILPA
jgi:hypothetical protein